MDAFVQHVDTEKQFQMVALVCLEGCKFPAGLRVAGIGRVDFDFLIDTCEPLRHMGEHFIHVLFSRTKDNVLPTALCDMSCKNLVQTIGPLQRSAKGIQVFLIGILDTRASHAVHAGLVFFQLVLIPEYSGHILGSRQNPPHDCFAQGHFRCDMAVEKFFCHIAVIVQIADVGGSQPQQLCLWAKF